MEIRGPITEAQLEDLRRLQKAQRHLLGLINDLLNFAKLDAGRVQFEIAELDVDEAIDGVEPLVRPQLNARGIDYEVTRSGGQRVWADAEKLRQVLVNLLGNAVKYTPPGGVVRVATSHDADTVTIRVADTGSGIPADKLRDIFDPFVQVGRSLSAVGDGGVGLGLAISRGIVHAMGGDIWAESEVGRGSTFFVRLGKRKPG
jgi:signal transduction histidine kinase